MSTTQTTAPPVAPLRHAARILNMVYDDRDAGAFDGTRRTADDLEAARVLEAAYGEKDTGTRPRSFGDLHDHVDANEYLLGTLEAEHVALDLHDDEQRAVLDLACAIVTLVLKDGHDGYPSFRWHLTGTLEEIVRNGHGTADGSVCPVCDRVIPLRTDTDGVEGDRDRGAELAHLAVFHDVTPGPERGPVTPDPEPVGW